MKKSRLLCGVLALAIMLCCAVLPLCANAQESVQTGTVTLKVYVQSGAGIAKNKSVDIYFQNTATKEEHKFTVQAGIDDTQITLPKGEYSVVKAVLTQQPEVGFETSIGKLTVEDSQQTMFTLSLKSVLTTEENKDTVAQLEKKSKFSFGTNIDQQQLNNFLLAIGMLIWLALGVVSVSYTVRSNFKKNMEKRDFLKAKGRIMRHILLGLLIGTCVGRLYGGKNGISWLAAVIGFGIPFGIPAVSWFVADREDDNRADDDDSSGGAIVIWMALATAIGIILAPIVIVRDIIDLVRSYRDYKNGIY